MQIRKLTFCALLALSACGKNAHHHNPHHHQTQAVYHTADGHWYAQNSAGDWFLLYALTAGQSGTSPAPITYPGPERPPGVWSASKAPSATTLRTSTKSEEEEEEEDGGEEADSSEDDSESDSESGEDSSAGSGADSDGGADSGGGDGGGGEIDATNLCQITVSSDEMAGLYTAHIRIDPRQAVLEILDQTIAQRIAASRQFYGPHPLIPGPKAQEAGEEK